MPKGAGETAQKRGRVIGVDQPFRGGILSSLERQELAHMVRSPMTALEISSSQSLNWLTGRFGEARVAKMGRQLTVMSTKFYKSE